MKTPMKSAAHSIVVRRPKRSDSRCFRHAQLLGEVGRQISQDDIEADGVENRAREGNSQGLRELDDLAKRGFLRVILVLKAGRLISVAANPQAIKSEGRAMRKGTRQPREMRASSSSTPVSTAAMRSPVAGRMPWRMERLRRRFPAYASSLSFRRLRFHGRFLRRS